MMEYEGRHVSDSDDADDVLRINDLSVQFGGIQALSGLSFDVPRGAILGLIGPNGAGKTTAFNIITRIYQPDHGSVILNDKCDVLRCAPHEIAELGIGRTFQNLALFPTLTVLENVLVGTISANRPKWWRSAIALDRAYNRHQRDLAINILEEFELSALAEHPAAELPYGTLKRIEIARALASSPQVLLLDEPAGGLTHNEVYELGLLIKQLRDRNNLTVLLVEHHMGLVMTISDVIVVLDFGCKIAEGTPAEIQQNARVIAAYLGSARGHPHKAADR